MVVFKQGARLLGALSRVAPGVRLVLALAALALILIPAEVWSQPLKDLSSEGFDSETLYVDERGGRYVFAPYQVLTNGDWRACPCAPASYLVLVGHDLSAVTLTSSEGAASLGGVSVTVDGRPTRVFAVSPGQVNFFLRADAKPPASTIVLYREGREVGRQSIRVGDSSLQGDAATADVAVEPAEMRLLAPPATQPSVHLLTTPLSFEASFDVVVEEGRSGRPFQAMVWNPRNFAGVSIVFGPPPEHSIEALVHHDRGQPAIRYDLGRYELSQPYHVQVELERGARVSLSVGPVFDPELERHVAFGADQARGLFEAYRPSLTVLSYSEAETNEVTLSNYRLALPHERSLAVRADDEKILPIALALLLLSTLWHAPLLVREVLGIEARLRRFRLARLFPDRLGPWWRTRVAVGLCGVLAFGAGFAFLASLGSHPFDMASQKVWTYLLVTDGIGDLYYRAQTVPVAAIWNGMPFHEGVYPYGVTMSYYFLAVGWIHRLLGGDVTPGSQGLEVTIKTANMVVAVAVAGLLLALTRGFGRPRFALIVPLAFLLNPAVLFDIGVWGETEPVALFFLLASLLAAQRSAARWAWLLLGLAFLGKQTIVLPAFLVGIYYLRIFSFRQIVDGVSVAVPGVIAAILPFLAAGYPPSVAIDPILGVFRVFGGSDMEEVFQVVSFDAYSVWPLVTLLGHGEHGVARLHFPDSSHYLGPLSYHQIGLFVFLVLMAALVVWILASKRVNKEPGLIFLVLAFAMLAELVLPTRAIARYLIFPLVVALAGSSQAPPRTVWFVIGVLTLTSLIGMYGSVASGLESAPAVAPRLAPSNNVISDVALRLFRSDVVITAGSLLNVAALLALAASLWLPRRADVPDPAWQPKLRRLAAEAA